MRVHCVKAIGFMYMWVSICFGGYFCCCCCIWWWWWCKRTGGTGCQLPVDSTGKALLPASTIPAHALNFGCAPLPLCLLPTSSHRTCSVSCGEAGHYLRYRVFPSCYRRNLPVHLKVSGVLIQSRHACRRMAYSALPYAPVVLCACTNANTNSISQTDKRANALKYTHTHTHNSRTARTTSCCCVCGATRGR